MPTTQVTAVVSHERRVLLKTIRALTCPREFESHVLRFVMAQHTGRMPLGGGLVAGE